MSRIGLSRRDFLQAASLFAGGLVIGAPNRFIGSLSRPVSSVQLANEQPGLPEFPPAERLGRVVGGKVSLHVRPDSDSPEVGILYDDAVVAWLREIPGRRPGWTHQRFVETPEGYIYAPFLQPVRHLLQAPLSSLPGSGLWMEVSVPYVEVRLANPPARAPWLKRTSQPRLYYSQVFWIDRLQVDEHGQAWYLVKERYGSYGDHFWAPAQALRPLDPAEIAPLNPEAEDKRVVVNLSQQTMTCLEGGREVFFCRVSTGTLVEQAGKAEKAWSTPPGSRSIWRKLISVHMTGGTTGGGYDIPGIAWTTLFSGNGVAIHSTFWHNSFGTPRSHGCVNAMPDDARWVFRWTQPVVAYDPGDVTISGHGSSKVVVIEH